MQTCSCTNSLSVVTSAPQAPNVTYSNTLLFKRLINYMTYTTFSKRHTYTDTISLNELLCNSQLTYKFLTHEWKQNSALGNRGHSEWKTPAEQLFSLCVNVQRSGNTREKRFRENFLRRTYLVFWINPGGEQSCRGINLLNESQKMFQVSPYGERHVGLWRHTTVALRGQRDCRILPIGQVR